MADYNSSRTGSQVDEISQINNKTFLSVMKGVTPSATAENSTIPTIGWVTTSNSWGSNKNIPIINGGTGADTVGGALQNLKVHPIGYIFEWSNSGLGNAPDLTTAAKVAQYFGYGTWEAYGSGRVLIGVGTTTDGDGETISMPSVGGVGGYKNSVAVSHTHSGTANSAGSHSHTRNYYSSDWCGSGKRSAYHGSDAGQKKSTGAAGAHTHTLTINSAGQSGADRNLQPYVVVYRWRRIA